MSLNKTQDLAEKIARILDAETKPADLSSIQASLDGISERLDRLELASANPQSQIPSPKLTHPSAERFAVVEAIADEIFGDLKKEKACTFEPNGRPCDHCAMCSSRGF